MLRVDLTSMMVRLSFGTICIIILKNSALSVSLVDGYNLPMSITNDVGCNVADCNADLNNDCPKELQLKDAAGNVVGCKSACGANGDTCE